MSSRNLAFEVLHAALMSLWIGSAITAGAAAAVTFPTMHQLNPRLPDYAGYQGEHWLLAGGKVMTPVFGFSGWVQVACVFLSALAFAVARWPGPGQTGRKLTTVRASVLVLVVAITGYQSAALRPRMMSNLNEQWRAAKAGDNTAAQKSAAAFDADHGTSNAVLGSSVGLGLLAIVLAAAAMSRRPRAEGAA